MEDVGADSRWIGLPAIEPFIPAPDPVVIV